MIPIFDGWYQNEDGTYDLCFAYFNMNLEEDLHIPVGPDNYVRPNEFDGNQPTHFHRVPPEARRTYCAFVVNVPANFGDRRVIWTLRRNGNVYATPGHITKREYLLEDRFQRSEDRVSPWVSMVAPVSSKPVRGRRGLTVGPAAGSVGKPMTLSVSVRDAEPMSTAEQPRQFEAYWYKHSGPPGAVTFSANHVELEQGQDVATVTATFAEPGEYVLRVLGMNGDFFSHCCWTNTFLRVTVTP
ncbi:MAG: hypothetical protein AB7F99_13285 [Vicinamibacterales bacterium]